MLFGLNRRFGIAADGRLIAVAAQRLALGQQREAVARRAGHLADNRHLVGVQFALGDCCTGAGSPDGDVAPSAVIGVDAFQARLNVAVLRQARSGGNEAANNDVL